MPGLLLILQLAAFSQAVTGVVLDPTGAPIAGARVHASGTQAISAPDGTFSLPATLPATVVISATGFADAVIQATAAGTPVTVVLHPRGITETLTVTAPTERSRVASSAAVTVLDGESLATAPALTLDEQLRSIPGFSLFRRSSSRVANPTTQGVTLRGMAASGASRATVVADGLSLNDPFGGWIYWDRVPAAAIERVEVARGGASDVYGSDAMGGAIRIETARSGARLLVDFGESDTARASLFGGTRRGALALRGGAELFTTAGYPIVEAASRGAVDVEAWSRHSTVFGAAEAGMFEVRGGYFAERRGNGTPLQRNSTTMRDGSVRARGDLLSGMWSAGASFVSQGYDQTFTAIAGNRAVERLTSAQRVDTSASTFSAEWFRGFSSASLFLAATGRATEATLLDQAYPVSFSAAAFTQEIDQRTGALVAQVSWMASPRTTVAGGARAELWRTGRGGITERKVGFMVPRASVSFRSNEALTLRFSFQDAYRVPTMNELYRSFQVGSVFTSANPRLGPEESYGIEGAALVRKGRLLARATAFLSRVNDAIVNVTLGSDGALIARQRANAGSIRASGLEFESEVRTWAGGAVTASAAWIASKFTSGELDGLRVPQVPRLTVAAGVRSAWRRASAALDWRYTSSQFDDDRNRFLLNDAAIADARVAWIPKRGVDVFLAVENVFDVEQDVGRTPVRTIGLPRTARVGLRIFLKPEA